MNPSVDVHTKRVDEPAVTIVYAARDEEHNNAVVLAGVLRDG